MQKASLPAAGLSMQDGDGLVNHIGTLVAVSHDMDTVVVDIPLKDGVLRVGATVTDNTKLLENGKRIGLEKFEPGDEVRMQFKRVPDGDVAALLERRPE
jgi:hypothetical protein